MNGAAVHTLLRRIDGLLPASPDFQLLDGRRVAGKCAGTLITSALQTLRDPLSGQVLAHEALARSFSSVGVRLSPQALFAEATGEQHLVELDRLCRTVHALNYRVCGPGQTGGKLVLNVHERLLHAVASGHGTFFREIVELIDLPPANVIIDIPLLKTSDVCWVGRVLESYRCAGFGVAIEAFSAAQAKLFAWLLRPDWLRLPAALIVAGNVAELQAFGSKVVATHVETPALHAHCLLAGVDLAQGFHYDRPTEAY